MENAAALLEQENKTNQARTRRSTEEDKIKYANLLITTLEALFDKKFDRSSWDLIPPFIDSLQPGSKKYIWNTMAAKTGYDRTKLYKFYNNTLKPYVMPAWPKEKLQHFSEIANVMGMKLLREEPYISHYSFIYKAFQRIKDEINYQQYMYKYPDNPAYSKIRNTLDYVYKSVNHYTTKDPTLSEEIGQASTDGEWNENDIDFLDSGYQPQTTNFFMSVPPVSSAGVSGLPPQIFSQVPIEIQIPPAYLNAMPLPSVPYNVAHGVVPTFGAFYPFGTQYSVPSSAIHALQQPPSIPANIPSTGDGGSFRDVEMSFLGPEISQTFKYPTIQFEHSGTGCMLDIFDSVEQ